MVFALPGAIEHADDAHQRGFARAGRPHDGDEIAFADFEVDAAEHPRLARARFVEFFDVNQFDHDRLLLGSDFLLSQTFDATNRWCVHRPWLFHGDDDQSGVVVPMAVAELARSLQNDFLQIFGACLAILIEQREQARFAELLAFRNTRFGDAVGKKQHAIAGCQVVLARGKLLDGKHAENAAAFQQAVMRAVAMKHDWRIVPGVGVTQLARRAVAAGRRKM